MSSPRGLTKTHLRILTLLGDGRPHTAEEVRNQLNDDLTDIRTVTVHITHIRRIIEPLNEDIVSFNLRGTLYYLWLSDGRLP